ncbi:hypothetical protein BHE74_00045418 [Ensete ventricosum]|nr:hypothetical protein BHE74_00045418 [Ensete ventricosum]
MPWLEVATLIVVDVEIEILRIWRRGDRSVRPSSAAGRATTRCGRMRPVADFRVGKNVHATMVVCEEEELVLTKHNWRRPGFD